MKPLKVLNSRDLYLRQIQITDSVLLAARIQRRRFFGIILPNVSPLTLLIINLGFTTAELHTLEAFAPLSDLNLPLLPPDYPIHPLFDFKNWDAPLP